MSEPFVKLYNWMADMGLNPSEMIVFAVIHSYTEHGRGYDGGLPGLTKWTGCSESTNKRAVKQLVESGWIVKSKPSKGKVATVYRSNGVKLTPFREVKMTPSTGSNRPSNGVKMTPDKKEIRNIIRDTPPLTPPQADNRVDSAPTIEEVRSYATEIQSRVDPDEFFAHYDLLRWKLYGKPIRDWKALFAKWTTDPERRKTGKKVNRALNYTQRPAYTREKLMAMGVSFGEELYTDDEDPPKHKNPALNYMQGKKYTAADLKELGISMGEEFYEE